MYPKLVEFSNLATGNVIVRSHKSIILMTASLLDPSLLIFLVWIIMEYIIKAGRTRIPERHIIKPSYSFLSNWAPSKTN